MTHWLIVVHQGVRRTTTMATQHEAFVAMQSIIRAPWRVADPARGGKIPGDYVAYQLLPDGIAPTG